MRGEVGESEEVGLEMDDEKGEVGEGDEMRLRREVPGKQGGNEIELDCKMRGEREELEVDS